MSLATETLPQRKRLYIPCADCCNSVSTMQGSSSFPCYSCYSHSDKNFLAIPSRLIHRESSKMKIRCINRGSSWNDLASSFQETEWNLPVQ